MTDSVASAVKKRAKSKRPKDVLYFVVGEAFVFNRDTGEMEEHPRGVLIPSGKFDRDEMRRKKYQRNTRLRGHLSKPRNYNFLKKAHYIAKLVSEAFEGYDERDWHEVLKKLQRESGIECDFVEVETVEFGTVTIKEARSLSFDDMDEGTFAVFYEELCEFIRNKFGPHMSREDFDALCHAMEKEQP